MGDFTSFGAKIWNWRRWRNLDDSTRLLWIGLYTTAQAKHAVPGLWKGSIAIISEETGMTPERVIRGLDRLLAVDLIEYDRDFDVLRMTELPDTGEWPSNENWLKGWWNRFVLIPECPIRNAHVATLRWILEQGARDRGKVIPKSVEQTWLDTFGRIDVPAQRRRGVARLEGDSDTSTAVQPSLFALTTPELQRPSTPSDVITPRANAGEIPSESEIVSEATSGSRVSKPSIEGFRASGTGTDTGTGISSSGGIGGDIHSPPKPTLKLVPKPGAFSVADLHAVLQRTGSRWEQTLRQRDHDALEQAIGELGMLFDGQAVLGLLREHIARGGLAGITLQEICRPGALSAAIEQAQARKRTADERAAMLAAALEAAK